LSEREYLALLLEGGRLVVLTPGGFACLWFVPTSAKRLGEKHV